MVDHDRYITNIRETDIKDTIDEILDYEYRTREELEKVGRSWKLVYLNLNPHCSHLIWILHFSHVHCIFFL